MHGSTRIATKRDTKGRMYPKMKPARRQRPRGHEGQTEPKINTEIRLTKDHWKPKAKSRPTKGNSN